MKVLRKQEIETADIQIGDQIVVPLAELGEFTATAHQVTDEGALFIFDDYVTSRPMNDKDTNEDCFEKSDLKKWMDTVLIMAFPEELRDKIYDFTLPTVGQIVGHEDDWNNKNLKPDIDEQLPLMKECKNRIACFEDRLAWGWLRNATKEELSSARFAYVDGGGGTYRTYALHSLGVRPEFWVIKQKSKNSVPHRSGYYPFGSKESLQDEISKKENEIKLLEQEIENLEEKEMYKKAGLELKRLKDVFVEAGFTKDEALYMVLELAKTLM